MYDLFAILSGVKGFSCTRIVNFENEISSISVPSLQWPFVVESNHFVLGTENRQDMIELNMYPWPLHIFPCDYLLLFKFYYHISHIKCSIQNSSYAAIFGGILQQCCYVQLFHFEQYIYIFFFIRPFHSYPHHSRIIMTTIPMEQIMKSMMMKAPVPFTVQQNLFIPPKPALTFDAKTSPCITILL